MKRLIFLLCFIAVITGKAQSPLPGQAGTVPVIDYTLTINENDLTVYTVAMHIKNAPAAFNIAMVKHFEYDDRFWRYLKDLKVEGNAGSVIRLDSALWKINLKNSEAVITYQIKLPAAQGWRGSWRPFLASNGGLVGGPHSFLYVDGYTQIPSHVTLHLPKGWTVATGLTPTADANIFYASSVYMLTDEPILAGRLYHWLFTIDGVPHKIAYYPLPDAKPFDTAMLVDGIKKITTETEKIFRGFPYSDYAFQLVEGTYGGLEHANSVTLGLNSEDVTNGFKELFAELAHEYFHTWNLVRMRPAEYGDVSYKNMPLAKELWWSEGATMFFADIILRRAGLPVYDSTRINHLEQLIGLYFTQPGNHKLSPEKVSIAANGETGMMGDYNASTHLQGELLSTMLDLIIRSSTNGTKSLDDVMLWMMNHFPAGRGFTNSDLENAIAKVCGCNIHSFFKDHIYGSTAIDFNTYLRLTGLHSTVTWKDVLDDSGRAAPDISVYAWPSANGKLLLGITDPNSAWCKAGLHTKDEILAINDSLVTSQKDFFKIIGKLRVGDTIVMRVKRRNGIYNAKVIITGHKTAVAKIEKLPNVNTQQQELYQQWNNTE